MGKAKAEAKAKPNKPKLGSAGCFNTSQAEEGAVCGGEGRSDKGSSEPPNSKISF